MTNYTLKTDQTLYENVRYNAPAKSIKLVAGDTVYCQVKKTSSGTFYKISKTIDGIHYSKTAKA